MQNGCDHGYDHDHDPTPNNNDCFSERFLLPLDRVHEEF
jgi:hypothetical protein